MSEDKIVQLSEIEDSGEIELGRGNVISTGDLSANPGNYPVYSSSAVGLGEFGRYGKYMFDEPLITWSVDGGGRPFLRKKHRFSVTNVCGYLRIRDHKKWDYGYLHAAILKAYEKIQFDYQAKAHPSVIRELYHLRWIPINEQRLIASILDTLDTQIQKTEALIAKLEKVKEGLLHDLLIRGIDENGRLRPCPEQAPELYKESPLGLIPREWETNKISDLSTKVTNGFVGVATPHYTESLSGVIYLYGNNIRKNRIDFRRHERVTQAFHKSQVKSQLKNGDMLTVQSGHIGTSAVYDSSAGEANCHALIITRFMPSQVNSRFASLYLNSNLGMLAQSRLFVGSTILHINTSDLAKLIIPVPSLNEQEKVVDHFVKIEDRLQLEAGQRNSLVKQKQGLMDDLLTGSVRVTPLLEQAQTQTASPA